MPVATQNKGSPAVHRSAAGCSLGRRRKVQQEVDPAVLRTAMPATRVSKVITVDASGPFEL